MKDAIQILSDVLNARNTQNPMYSLRAFARDLAISPQQLSNVMNGQRGLSPGNAIRIAKILNLNRREEIIFVESFRARFALSKAHRRLAKLKLQELENEPDNVSLNSEIFNSISSWHHFAILALIKNVKVQADSIPVFSRILSIPENEVLMSLSRLEKAKLITRMQTGWRLNQKLVSIDSHSKSSGSLKFHKQLLEKALRALSLQNENERINSSVVFPIKVKNLARAKEIIRSFQSQLTREITDDVDGEEIYSLNIQMFRFSNFCESKQDLNENFVLPSINK